MDGTIANNNSQRPLAIIQKTHNGGIDTNTEATLMTASGKPIRSNSTISSADTESIVSQIVDRSSFLSSCFAVNESEKNRIGITA